VARLRQSGTAIDRAAGDRFRRCAERHGLAAGCGFDDGRKHMNKVEFSRTAKVPFGKRYGNYIGGKWADPISGKYFDNTSPVNGRVLCEIARSDAKDVEAALDAAHAAKEKWGKTSVAERSLLLNKIADRMEANLATLALAETWDNGKPI